MAYKKREHSQTLNKDTFCYEVTIPRSEQRVMYSHADNREYRIFIAKPDGEPPASGYPVIYILDANAVFGTMVETVRVQSRMPERSGVYPAIIVGIGYHTEGPFDSARHYDFTLPAPMAELPPSPDGKPWPEQGGANAFLTFIEEELKPEIERDFKIDTNHQTIFGHSLGGLFVLHTLFTKPHAFQTYIAGSPSIHWNERLLLEEANQFLSRFNQEHMNKKLLLSVGELEKTHQSRVNEKTKTLSERLSTLESQGLRVVFKEFEGENHVSVLPILISHAVRFALIPKA